MELSIPFALRAADELRTPVTHYVPYFQGLLDYIWWAAWGAGFFRGGASRESGAAAGASMGRRAAAGRVQGAGWLGLCHALHAWPLGAACASCSEPCAQPAPARRCRFEEGAVEAVREVPLPSLEELHARLGGFLPSAHFPSDHFAVVYDLRFRQ